MPTHYQWRKTISNGYATKVIRGTSKADVEQRAAVQLSRWQQQAMQRQAKWNAQVARQAAQDQLRALEMQAQAQTDDAQTRMSNLNSLLQNGLGNGKHFDWNAAKDHRAFPPFQFMDSPPTYESVARRFKVPAPSTLEALFGYTSKKREELESQARAQFNTEHAAYEARKADAYRDYQQRQANWEDQQRRFNVAVDTMRSGFGEGEPKAVVWVIEQILNELDLPEEYCKDFDVAFDTNSGTAVVNMPFPTLDEVPRVTSYKFVKSRKAIDQVEMKQKDLESLYDSILQQIALLTISRIFRDASTPALQSVVFNGWVTGVDRKTGNDFTSCVLSVQAPRATFASLNLTRVDPKECIRSLKGLVAGPLAQLAPVRPILDLNTEDARFIESREVLANLNSQDNLAVMDWEEFEHLVRELFGKVFGSDGAEVRVTQASRDQGVDAIAFDPDPIRGGKFVIQAKRYNNVVPVSAVRDLYGTMINEGAAKGILVTTSHYGNDSREFAKDKPITLIDGANLVHMLQQYGYDVRIDVKK